MKRNLLYLLAFVSVTVTVSTVAYNKHILRSEEGLVYTSIFDTKPKIIKFKNIITLSKPSVCNSSQVHYKSLPTETVNEFIKANKEGTSPIRLTALEGNVPIVSWEDTKNMHNKGITNTFKPMNKKLFYLSRVGFNKQRTSAIVCIEISEHNYGQGILLFLQKKENDWEVTKNINLWVS